MQAGEDRPRPPFRFHPQTPYPIWKSFTNFVSLSIRNEPESEQLVPGAPGVHETTVSGRTDARSQLASGTVDCGATKPSAKVRFLALSACSYGRFSRPAQGRTVAFVSNLRSTLQGVVCERCQRSSGTRSRGSSGNTWGRQAALVADCPKLRSSNICDRCKAVFARRG